MFIHELDISWMKSPFLRHRRKIKSKNDIALLKKAGVKQLYIDISRGIDVPDNSPVNTDVLKNEQTENKKSAADDEPEIEEKCIAVPSAADVPDVPDVQTIKNNAQQPVSLNEELQVAKKLQGKICQLVEQLSRAVKNGQPISAASISPIIDESVASISRNDQALLTLLHLHRQDLKLNDHAFGVFSLILPLAIKLNCSKEEINELAMAALLHDIGWARLPMHLLAKKSPLPVLKNNSLSSISAL